MCIYTTFRLLVSHLYISGLSYTFPLLSSCFWNSNSFDSIVYSSFLLKLCSDSYQLTCRILCRVSSNRTYSVFFVKLFIIFHVYKFPKKSRIYRPILLSRSCSCMRLCKLFIVICGDIHATWIIICKSNYSS